MDGGAAMKTDSGKYDTAGDCLFELSLHVRPGHLCRVAGVSPLNPEDGEHRVALR
jgi:hypothetical protein